jgi:hypothetical protein
MAFHFSSAEYRGLFAPFLDDYLKNGTRMAQADLDLHRQVFLDTVEKVKVVFGNTAFRRFDEEGNPERQVNRAVFDVVMLSFARMDRDALEAKREQIVEALRKLSQDDKAFIDAIIQATRDRKRINTRLERWINAVRFIGIRCPEIKFGN